MSTGHVTNGKRPKNADRWSDQSKVQVVYFLASTSGDSATPFIKIGETKDHEKRLDQHRMPKHGIEFNVTELCVVRGERADEQQVLRHFRKYLVNDREQELFHPADELLDYIRWLRDQYFVWVPDDITCQSISELCLVDASLWMPSGDRLKKGPDKSGLFSDFGPLNMPPREISINDFYTNEIIIEAAREALGGIDLDPASHAIANTVVKANAFYSMHDNGLLKKWAGRVWLNPPFSDWQPWVKKIAEEWAGGKIESMCVLSATRTTTAKYFADIHKNCTAWCVLCGRVPFWGKRAGSPDDGHAVFYFGNDADRFAGAFGQLGHIYVPWKP